MDERERQATELIRQGQQNLAEAIPLLAELYGPIVLSQCQVYLPEREAQKIAEQTFEEYVRGKYKRDSLSVTLLKLATRLSRARARTIEFEQFITSNGQNPQGRLSPREKEDYTLWRLRHHLHLSWAEIADIMGLPSADAAKTRGYRLALAKKRLEENKNVR